MASSQASLSNTLFFPLFSDLPLLDDMDSSFFLETAQGEAHVHTR